VKIKVAVFVYVAVWEGVIPGGNVDVTVGERVTVGLMLGVAVDVGVIGCRRV